MKLAVIGVNHKTAPIAIRERLSFGADLQTAIKSLQKTAGFCGATIVSTCNRSEIYIGFDEEWHAQTDDDDTSPQSEYLTEWLANFKGIDAKEISPFLYTYEYSRALNHWLRVASGLDSMILGEPQILGQIRQAVTLSKQAGGINGEFDWLTQQIFAAARSVRRDTKLGEQAVTLGFATAKLVTQIFDKPANTTLLIVAAGEMNRLVAHNVASLGMTHIIIANRTPERAEHLKNELIQLAASTNISPQIDCVGLDKISEVLKIADIVSSCSGSMHTLIDYDMVKSAQKHRRHRPMLLVDLAVPRDIDPSVTKLDNIYLYSVDDLQHVIEGNLKERKQAAVEAELLVSQLTAKIEAQLQIVKMGQVISQYQIQTHAKTEALLSHAKKQLATGKNAEDVIAILAYQLQHTLTHPTLKLLRQSAVQFDGNTCHELGDMLLTAYRSVPQ